MKTTFSLILVLIWVCIQYLLIKKVAITYSIEPHPVNLSYLSMNSTANKSDIHMYGCGFSDSDGYMKISGPRKNMHVDGCASIKRTNNSDDENTVSVRLERGDKFIKQNRLETPQMIKIDVEGAEMGVLRGLEGIINQSDCRVIYCEIHDDDEFGEIEEYLNSFGYSTSTIGGGRIIKSVSR